jgi:hypothetical protein
MQKTDQTAKPPSDEKPQAHELTAFELALVTGGSASGCNPPAEAGGTRGSRPSADLKV